MNYMFITGTSSGIGKALAEYLLEDETNYVIGMSRRCTLSHPRYEHIEADLSDMDFVADFAFKTFDDAESYALVNNAGLLGELGHVGKLDNRYLIKGFHVNVTAPAVLMNTFIRQFRDFKGKKVILNTSSGAARHAVTSWGMYCGTKAGLEMYTRVVHKEQEEAGHANPVYAFSVAPGIIDTPMQEQIRAASKSEFQNVDRFINLWKNNELVAPRDVAENFTKILKNPGDYSQVAMDLRD